MGDVPLFGAKIADRHPDREPAGKPGVRQEHRSVTVHEFIAQRHGGDPRVRVLAASLTVFALAGLIMCETLGISTVLKPLLFDDVGMTGLVVCVILAVMMLCAILSGHSGVMYAAQLQLGVLYFGLFGATVFLMYLQVSTLGRLPVRGALAIQLALFACGRSGVRLELVESLLARLQADDLPTARLGSSVGASDIVAMSQLAVPLIGRIGAGPGGAGPAPIGGLAAKEGSHPAMFGALIMVFALLCWASSLFIPPTGQGAPNLRVDPNIARSTGSLAAAGAGAGVGAGVVAAVGGEVPGAETQTIGCG